jgi:bacterioferritin-associated ferredoxin
VIVCHCRAVSDRTIRACARAGVSSIEEVGQLTGAALGCGGCQDLVEQILCEEQDPKHSQPCLASGARRLPIVGDPWADVA